MVVGVVGEDTVAFDIDPLFDCREIKNLNNFMNHYSRECENQR